MASSSLIGSLRVALSLGTADFEAGANKAASIAKTKAKEIEGAFGGAKRAVEGLFAAFTVGLLTEQIKKSLDYAGSLKEVASTLGVTTTQLQQFRYAATQTGVSQEVLEMGLRKLTISMGNAEAGAKKPIAAFKAIGVSVDQLKGKNTGDVFLKVADGLAKYSDRAQRASVETALMSRNGSQLDNMLKGGSARINELSEAANRLGIVLSPELILHAEETSHKLEALKMVLSAQIAGVVAQNASAILSLSSALATLTGSIIRFLGSNPQLALGIIGALLGGRVGGIPGALLGGAAGALLGGKVAQNADEINDDLAVRRQQLIEARDRLHAAESSGGAGPAMSVAGIQTGGGAGPNVGQLRNDLQHQVDRYYQAIAAAKAANAPLPKGPDIPKFLAEKGPKKKTPEDKNEEEAFKFAQEERQLNLQILEAKRGLVHDVGGQAEISLQMLDVQRQIRDADIDHKVAQAKKDLAEKKITQSTYNQVVTEAGVEKAKEGELIGLQRKAILEQRDQQLLRQSIELDQQGYDIMKGDLEKQLSLAQTADERLKIELEILNLTYKWRRILDQRIIAESKDPVEVLHAQADLAAIPKDYALDRQNTIKQNLGPLGDYIRGLPTDAAKWQEALQGVAVNGFGALEQAILDTVNGTKKLGAAFADMAKSIIADLIKIGLERTIIAPLANALFPQAASGGGLAGALGGLFGGAGAGAGAGALNLDEAAGLFGFAAGGFVSGAGGPTSDSIPAMLSNGEFVMNSGAVRGFGVPFFNAINSGQIKPSDIAGGAAHHGGGGLGFLKYLSPLAAMASSKGGKGFLAALSPAAFLASKLFHFSQGGYVGGIPISRPNFGGMQPAFAGGGSGMGAPVTFHFHNHARMSDGEARRTGTQVAAGFNAEMAAARRKGVV